MWYEKLQGVPRPGSLLESVFIEVVFQRQNAALLESKALLTAMLLPENAKIDPAVEAFQKYLEAMIPFLDGRDQEKVDQRTALEEFVKYKAKINVRDYFAQQTAIARRVASLRSLKRNGGKPS